VNLPLSLWVADALAGNCLRLSAQNQTTCNRVCKSPGLPNTVEFHILEPVPGVTNPDYVAFTAEERAQIEDAINAWSSATNSPSLLPGVDFNITLGPDVDELYANDFVILKTTFFPNGITYAAYGDLGVHTNIAGCPVKWRRIAVNANFTGYGDYPHEQTSLQSQPDFTYTMMHEIGHSLGFAHFNAEIALMNPLLHYGGDPVDCAMDPDTPFYRLHADEFNVLESLTPSSTPTTNKNLMLYRFDTMPEVCPDADITIPTRLPEYDLNDRRSWLVWTGQTAECYQEAVDRSCRPIENGDPDDESCWFWFVCEGDCYGSYETANCEITPPAPITVVLHDPSATLALPYGIRFGLIDDPNQDCANPDAVIADKTVLLEPGIPTAVQIEWDLVNLEGIPDTIPGVGFDVGETEWKEFHLCAKIDPDDIIAEVSEDDNAIVSDLKMMVLDQYSAYCC
jgi:hypothetical protein